MTNSAKEGGKKLLEPAGFRQAGSGGNKRKPLTNHSVISILSRRHELGTPNELVLTFETELASGTCPTTNSVTDQCVVPMARPKVIHRSKEFED